MGRGSYTDGLRGVEHELAGVSAVDEQRPHHEGRGDGLNVVHQRQLDLLMAAGHTSTQSFPLLLTHHR